MLKQWKKISSSVVFKNPWWTYKQDSFKIPDGIEGEYHYVHTNGASMIVPVSGDGKILLVNQFRYLCAKESIEFPCGGVKDGSTYEATAASELEEETGCRSDTIDYAAEFNPYNGVTDEICKVYIARNLSQVTAVPDSTEEFEILHRSIDEVDTMIKENVIWDGMTIAAWALVRFKL